MKFLDEHTRADIRREVSADEPLSIDVDANALYSVLVLTKIGMGMTHVPFYHYRALIDWIEKATETLEKVSPTAAKVVTELDPMKPYHL